MKSLGGAEVLGSTDMGGKLKQVATGQGNGGVSRGTVALPWAKRPIWGAVRTGRAPAL
jgi:hypothetical protein